ncbi:MAG: SPASM domain-containing protein [Brevinematia bacterium]
MLPLLIIKDIDINNDLFSRIGSFEKIFVENSPNEIIKVARNYEKVIITWNSTTIIDLSLIESLLKQNSEISFIANLPDYMEFEIWNSEFLIESLKRHNKTSKPLRYILPSIELDESIYYTDIIEKDIRLYRFELSPLSHKGIELSKKILSKINISQNVPQQIESIIKNNPEYLVEIPTFYYIEISSEKINTLYTPSWEEKIDEINVSNFEKILSKIIEYSKTLGIMIGIFNEPLYHTQIDEILKVLGEYKNKQVTFIINTSLPTLPESLVKLLTETKDLKGFRGYPFLNIFIDLPSTTKENYEKLKSLDFSLVMENLKKLISVDPKRVFIKFVRNKYNDEELRDFYNNLKQYQIIIQRPQNKEITSVDTILPTRIPCYKLQTSLAILPNGDTLICINDINKKHNLGNILSKDVKEICLNKTRKIKEHFSNNFLDICENCIIWDQFDL